MNSHAEIRSKLIEIFELTGFYLPINVEEDDINITDYDISSLEYVSILIQIEDEFGISIPDEKLTMELFYSFNGLVEFIHDLLKKQ